ncbi:hypothetical protein PIB30_013447 [Stylosanthes scabra]|uniref:Uncharacterized protein n=1 Tax=Stylosanthes scabra TaxID=79078 RepID=A0ABU6Y5A1_9FABA|nr:hypothetical protein [Stylosanthes scabra]
MKLKRVVVAMETDRRLYTHTPPISFHRHHHGGANAVHAFTMEAPALFPPPRGWRLLQSSSYSRCASISAFHLPTCQFTIPHPSSSAVTFATVFDHRHRDFPLALPILTFKSTGSKLTLVATTESSHGGSEIGGGVEVEKIGIISVGIGVGGARLHWTCVS